MAWIDTHTGDTSIRRYYLVSLVFDTPMYLTDCDVPLDYTYRWEPCALDVTAVQPANATQARATISIGDPSGTLMSNLLDTNGGSGVSVTILSAWLSATNKTAVPDAVVTLMEGVIDSASKRSGDSDYVELSIGAASRLESVQIPARLISSLMRYIA